MLATGGDCEREQHTQGRARRTRRARHRVEGVRSARRAADHRSLRFRLLHDRHGARRVRHLETIADLAAWFAATDISPIVRIHKAFVHHIPLMLDQGIMGIQISGVENADEARAIVQEAKYPPIGSRGMSGMGPHTGYKSYGARYQTEYAPGRTRTSSSARRSSRSKD